MGKKRDSSSRWESSSSEDESRKKKKKNKKKNSKKSKRNSTDEKSTRESKNPPSSDDKETRKPQPPGCAASLSSSAVTSQPASSQGLPLHNPLLHGCRSVYDTYDRISRVSEGTYGVVWKAKDLATQEIVALKQIKFNVGSSDCAETKNGFPVTALREMSVLLELCHHESIVSVREIVVGDAIDKVFLVMQYFEFDLKDGINKFDGPLFQSELKGIMKQILSAVHYMHSRWYLHRDLKTSNILVHRSGRIAVADFGLARRYEIPQSRQLTQLVCTLWYRAPELLFGECRYGPAVDMWSVGCIFGELICKDAIMQGQGELDQIDQIFSMVGVPNEGTWPGFDGLPNAGLFRWKPRKQEELLLPQKFRVTASQSGNKQAFLDNNGYNLLEMLLTLDPSKRIAAKQAESHPYFTEGVKPQVPRFFSSS